MIFNKLCNKNDQLHVLSLGDISLHNVNYMGCVFHPEVILELFAIPMQAINIDAYLEIKCMILQSEGLEIRRHININPLLHNNAFDAFEISCI